MDVLLDLKTSNKTLRSRLANVEADNRALRHRVNELQQELNSYHEQDEQVANAERLRARQLHPAAKDFWKSRGFDDPPWRWDSFAGSDLALAHHWPQALELIRDVNDWDELWDELGDEYGMWDDAARDDIEYIFDKEEMAGFFGN